MRARTAGIGLAAVVATMAACASEPVEPPATKEPAVVEAYPDESGLTTVRLTPEAVERLRIETVPVGMESIRRMRTVHGEVVVPPGRTISLTAPVAGTLIVDEEKPLPTIGTRVRQGQTLFRLMPLDRDLRGRSPLAEATQALATAQADYDIAQIRVSRAEQLLKDLAGSQRSVDDARAALAQAEAAVGGAEAQIDYLRGVPLEAGTGLMIVAPLDAELLQVFAVGGQSVAAGERLVEMTDLASVWIRVPVYVGELDSIASGRPALVHRLGALPDKGAVTARPIVAPPSASLDSSTVDLFFELPGAAPTYRPGQRLGVTLELSGAAEALRIPWSAVVQDVSGGSWVYVETTRATFVRTRVAVERVDGDMAVLAHGPAIGTAVVVAGAAELFGTEFGVGGH